MKRNVLLLIVLLSLACPGFACADEQTLAQMDHATWTARDGAPQGINALAQSKDGTLWIGSESGLVNFDGRTFTPFRTLPGDPRLPAEAVYSLCVTKDDTLWVSFMRAGAAQISHGRVRFYRTVDGRSFGSLQHLTQAADGSIWAVSRYRSLVRFGADLAWHTEPVPETNARLDRFQIDSSSTLWIGQAGRLYKRALTQSPATYTATEVQAGIPFGFAEMDDGSMWMADVQPESDRGRIQQFDRFGHLLRAFPDLDDEPVGLLHTPDGSIIIASQRRGIRRFSPRDQTNIGVNERQRADVFTSIDGLSSNEPRALLLDADSNIWVGGRRGLDRFRKAQLVRFIPQDPAGSWHLCNTAQGNLWISSTSKQLYKVTGAAAVSIPHVGDIYRLFCGSNGEAWFADHAGIWHVHENRLTGLPPIPDAPPYTLQGIVATADDTVYVASALPPAWWQYKNGKWTKVPPDGLTGGPGLVYGARVYLDSHDRLWAGYSDGRVALPLERRTLAMKSPGLGSVNAILETSHGMLATGTNGLAILRDDELQMLAFADPIAGQGIGGIAESGNGDLWMNSLHGVLRISASEINSALTTPDYHMKSDLLTEGDFVGGSNGITTRADAARDSEGNLWFVTINGVMHIDPKHWRAESRPPVIAIRSIAVDQHPLDGSGIIDPRPRALAIRYFGVNLTAPEQVVYRYRLDGFDSDWQDVGHRTEAIYTRLPAGRYKFRVMAASSGNGPWTEPVSSADLTVLPSFYQTTWFAGACLGVACVILFWINLARVRIITREVRARAEERADERFRIAREIHDTLLQGVQGLLLTIHVAVQKMSKDTSSKEMLEGALSTADRIIIEGRNRVSSLRAEHLSDAELIASITNVSNDLRAGDGARVRVNRFGSDAKLHSYAADEIFFIAREALTNAFRHAHALQITLDLAYGNRFFTMVCRDDGRGFDPQDSNFAGHWGIRGMVERVRQLGGELYCFSTPQRGTEIRLSIPAYRAYVRSSRSMFYLRAFSLRGDQTCGASQSRTRGLKPVDLDQID